MRRLRILAAILAAALPAGWAGATPLDLSDATSRDVYVWIEQSDSTAPGSTPGVLDAEWSDLIRGSYTSDGTTATVVIPGADVEAAVTAAGFAPVAGSFSDYVWNFDVATGDSTGSFTGDVIIIIDAITVSWNNQVDSTLAVGYENQPAAFQGVDHWRSCTSGGNCTLVSGVTGTSDWTWTTSQTWTISTFSPWGEVRFGEVPEPSPVLLMGLGLGGLAFLSRRRRIRRA